MECEENKDVSELVKIEPAEWTQILPTSCTRCRFYIGADDGSCLMNCIGGLYKYTDTVYEDCKIRPDFKYGDYWTDFEKVVIEEKLAAANNINKEGEE